MKKVAIIAAVLWCVPLSLLFGQERPFPQNIKYPYGIIPTGISSGKIKTEYDRWKRNILAECNGGYRVNCLNEDGADTTKVEGMGFGMLIAAYMGDKEVFDGLYKFYKSKCNANAGNMMMWQVTCDGGGQGSASDGDVDVAFGLIVASWQWPDGGYAAEAKKVIDNLRSQVVKSCSGNLLSLAAGVSGSAWGGCDYLDISYFNPAAFREFAKVGNKSDSATWVKLADDTYTLLNRGANSSTGLVPDWQYFDGRAGGGGREGNYKYDACRTPWRIALDYLWNGNQQAQTWCKKVSNWANGVGPANIMDGYSLSGSAIGSNYNGCFVGGFACAAMCNTQQMADAFAAELVKIVSRDNVWFTQSVSFCNMLTMTGNQWRPGMTGVNRDRPARDKTDRTIRWRVHGGGLSVENLPKGVDVTLTTLTGRRIAAAKAENGTAIFNSVSLSRGCYLLVITHEGRCGGEVRRVSMY